MNNKTEAFSPPRLIPSIIAGFNLVANNITIIIFPVILDIFLWLGPHLRIRELFLPAVNEMSKYMTELNSVQFKDYIGPVKELQLTLLERFNFFSGLHTFPIGVPSLLSSSLDTLKTPLGASTFIEVQSLAVMVMAGLYMLVIGLLAGSLYFYNAARIGSSPKQEFSTKEAFRQWVQVLLLSVSLILLLILLIIPISLLFSTVLLLDPTVAQIIILIVSILVLWILFPLVFSTHGIYAKKQNLITSTLTSIRLVRFFLPGAGFYLLISVFIYQGMGIIWTMAPTDSWMIMVGIIGHAFTSSGLLVASFVYYNGGVKWMEENIRRLASLQNHKSTEAAGQQ
jgi:hypothetical protein